MFKALILIGTAMFGFGFLVFVVELLNRVAGFIV
jgi:hypothetical protein